MSVRSQPRPAVHAARAWRVVVVRVLPPVLAALLALPFLLSQNAWLEWSNALWLLEVQAAHVRGTGLPSAFIHLPGETFYPQQLLYGGWTFSLLAYPAVVLGAWPVFAATTAGAFVGIERGITWFARNLGVPRNVAPLLGLAVVATPYTVSDLYGRGAWTEVVAFAGAALAFGAGTALLRAPGRLPLGPAVGLVAAVALTAGTHTVTLVMGALVAPFVLVVAWLGGALPTTRRRVLETAALVVAGVGVVAITVVPSLAFGPDTAVAQPDVIAGFHDRLRAYSSAAVLLSPWPRTPAGAGGTLYAQASLILLLWPVAAAVLLRRTLTARRTIALAVAAVVQLVLLWALTHPDAWHHFPQTLQILQFPFRLIPWLGLLGATACALLLRGTASRRLTGALAVLVGAQVALALGTAAFDPTDPGAHVAVAAVHAAQPPLSFADPQSFQPIQYLVRDRPLGPAPATLPLRSAAFAPLTADALHLSGTASAGTVVTAPIAWSPWVRVTGGAHIAGRTAQGWATLRVDHAAGGRWTATARPACTVCLGHLTGGPLFSLALGQLLTGLTLAAVAAWLALTLLSRRRTPRQPQPPPAPPPAVAAR